MRKLVIAGLAVLFLAAVSTAFAADETKATIKIGGGVIFDGTVPGGGLGVDINISEKPAAIEIFFDYFNKSGVTMVPAGVRFLYKAPVAEKKAGVYFGAGGGIGYWKMPSVTLLGVTIGGSTTKGLVTALFGVNIKAGEKAGIFIEGAYYRMLTSGASNDVAGRAGISFNVGSK